MEEFKLNEIWRKTVGKLTKYVPGIPIELVQEKYGLTDVIKLASNENPNGTSPKAKEAMISALDDVNLYPEKEANMLRDRLSELHDLSREHFVITNGGEYAITLLGGTFLNPKEEAIYCVPTFGVYRSSVIKQDAIPIELPLDDQGKYDTDAILQAMTGQTKLVFVCNPNNPTGTILEKEKIELLVNGVPKDTVIIFDEAYFEFIDDPEYDSAIDYVRKGKNVAVIRTFSKLFGMAGARMGYVAARPDIIEKIFMVREAFSANRIAIAGAAAALDDRDFIKLTIDNNNQGRAFIEQSFQKLGIPYYPSSANFVLAKVDVDVQLLYERMLRRGIAFRPIEGKMRVSVGTMSQNQAFMDALIEELDSLRKEQHSCQG